MIDEIKNKVANSALLTIDLEDWYPENFEKIDMADYLFQGLLLREKDFRESLKNIAWDKYTNKEVVIFCSADAIVPTWAYMLMSIFLNKVNASVTFGSVDKLIEDVYSNKINTLNLTEFVDKRIVIKGCSKKNVPVLAYVKLAAKLQTVAKSIMYGEPCSTVPLYKKQ